MSIVVPHEQLQPETLRALIEEFITREGAVHGHRDAPLEAMVESVKRQLASGKVLIVFNGEDETCTIMPKEEVGRMEDVEGT